MEKECVDQADENIVEIDFQDVIRIASGVDDAGNPNSSVSLAIYKLGEREDDILTEQEVAFSNAVTSIFASGGCIVVQVDFPSSCKFESRRATQIAAEWMGNMNSEAYKNKFLSLVIVPLQLFGQIYISLSELVYFSAFYVAKDETRLILCFDNTSTQCYETGDIDLESIQSQVDQELRDEEQALDDEAYDIEQQIKKLQEYNPYEEEIRRKYSSVDSLDLDNNAASSETFRRPGYRFGDGTDSRKESKDEEDEENS